jgi:serine/threonine protein kinase
VPIDDSQPGSAAEEPGEGSILGRRYRLIRRLGAGGAATVFLAEDELLGREVAVKLLRTESTRGAARRFAREARLGAALNHPNIVAVYDIVTESDQVVIVMEYVRGSDLAEALREGPLEEEKALRVLAAVAAALDHAHARGIVHRDVKPSNVLISDDGAIKLADLGIAKALADTDTTEAGFVPGTPIYMAPELLSGKRVTPAADVCSLGLVAYEMLSGRRPRSGRTVPEVAQQAATQPPPDLRTARPQTPPAAAELLHRAMHRDPARRPATAGELVEAVGAALAKRPARAEQPPAAAEVTEPAMEPSERGPQTEGLAALPSEPELEEPSGPSRPPREFSPSPPTSQRSRKARWAVPALLAVVLALVVVMAALFAGGGSEEAPSSPEPGSSGSATEEKQAPEPMSPAAAERAVQSFYERAAAGDYEGAEALTTPALISQIGGFDQFDTLESIRFEQLEGSVSGENAEVSISTVATHTDRVDDCSGSAVLVFDDKWLLDRLAVDCG